MDAAPRMPLLVMQCSENLDSSPEQKTGLILKLLKTRSIGRNAYFGIGKDAQDVIAGKGPARNQVRMSTRGGSAGNWDTNEF
jgi:hypothetical protein